jgi:exodeoxyribonuclease V beta subunit
MKSFDVLHPETNVHGVHFLEASAGTGKTFSIEHLVSRLILEGEEPLTIDQILVMTFTNAATRELKIRIRKTLEKIEEILLKKREANRQDYLGALLEKGEETRKISLRRVEEALASFASAQIFTIHGFCHRMLGEFAFEAHVPFGLGDPEANEYQVELQSLIKDFFRCELSLTEYSARQLEILLKKHHHDTKALIRKLALLLEKGTEILSGRSFSQIQKELQTLLIEGKGQYKSGLVLEDFKRLSSCYKRMGNQEIYAQAQKFSEILEKADCTEQDLDAFLQYKEFFLKGMEKSNLKVRAALPDIGSLHYPGLFERMRRPLLSLIEEAKDPAHILLRMAKDCHDKMGRQSFNSDRMHPDELLNKMRGALCNPHFVEKARKRYRAAIIDEFQDTDPVQWDLFSTLFLSQDMKAVYLVGDPKQSIYAFRSADLYTYLKAKEALGQDRHAFLDTNFRSEPDLVEALNILFSAPWMRLPFLNQTLSYPPVKPASNSQNQELHDDRGSVHFFLHEESREREKTWPSFIAEETMIFPALAKEIHLLHEQLNVSYEKIAILVKDRFQEKRLFDFLKKANIPAHVRKKTSLSETLSFSVMKELLEAVNDPADFCKVKRVLGGPLISWPHTKLAKNQQNTDMAYASGRFFTMQQKLQKKGFAVFFHDFLLDCWTDKTVLEHLLSLDDLSLYFDLRHLADRLIEKENSASFTCDSLIFYLKELESETADEDERGRIFKEEEEEKVLLLTTHASKGLEFDFVFALGIASRHSSSESWIRVKREQKEQIEVFDLQTESSQLALKELDAEKMRQLYVALTRAKRRVYVPFLIDANAADLSIGQASPLELFFSHHLNEQIPSFTQMHSLLEEMGRKAKITYSHLQENVLLAKEPEKRSVPELFFAPTMHFSFTEERVYSFSSLAQGTGDDAKIKILADDKAISLHSMPAGKDTGNFLHHLFEKIIQHSWHFPFQEDRIRSLLAFQVEASFLAGWEEALFQMIKKAFFTPLFQGGFCLAHVSARAMQQEMEFLLPVHDFFLKGFIDLVFQHQGKYYLLDWKSNWLGPSSESYREKDLQQAMKEHDYFLQASIYAIALQRYVKLFDKRPFEECFGGAFYFFLRGEAVYHFFPDLSILDNVDPKKMEGARPWEE